MRCTLFLKYLGLYYGLITRLLPFEIICSVVLAVRLFPLVYGDFGHFQYFS